MTPFDQTSARTTTIRHHTERGPATTAHNARLRLGRRGKDGEITHRPGRDLTVHAFQGRTVDTVIAAMEANHPHLTTQKSFYVEISRARDRAELVTDDKAALKEQLEAVTGERIAALEAVKPERAKGRESDTFAPRNRDKSPESKIEQERAPRSVDRDLGL